MPMVSKKPPGAVKAKRDKLLTGRLGAVPLRQLFPDVGQLHIELVFHNPRGTGPSPSPQQHTLYAAAPAFFRYPCPCTDCDGDFDLGIEVSNLIRGRVGRPPAHSLSGQIACQGMLFTDHGSLQARCSMQLSYTIHTR